MINELATKGKPKSQRRRQVLALGGLATIGLLSACGRPSPWAVTFFQPWAHHAKQSQQQWHEHLSATSRLGFSHVILQWTGRQHGAADWQFSDDTMTALLDTAQNLGMGISAGLPHDDRWHTVLTTDSLSQITSFFDSTLEDCSTYAGGAPWRTHSAFRGWYIPYEIEQYSWDTAERAVLLASWLKRLSACIMQHSDILPGISTYVSRLDTGQTLESLWQTILSSEPVLRPMLQDGVGVAGQEHYARLAPLEALLQSAEIDFDLIIELFVQKNKDISTDAPFDAISADYAHIEDQLRAFNESGADRAVAFAVDPWVIGPTPEAQALLKHWKKRPPRKR